MLHAKELAVVLFIEIMNNNLDILQPKIINNKTLKKTLSNNNTYQNYRRQFQM